MTDEQQPDAQEEIVFVDDEAKGPSMAPAYIWLVILTLVAIGIGAALWIHEIRIKEAIEQHAREQSAPPKDPEIAQLRESLAALQKTAEGLARDRDGLRLALDSAEKKAETMDGAVRKVEQVQQEINRKIDALGALAALVVEIESRMAEQKKSLAATALLAEAAGRRIEEASLTSRGRDVELQNAIHEIQKRLDAIEKKAASAPTEETKPAVNPAEQKPDVSDAALAEPALLRVTLDWTGQCDLDLVVIDPQGRRAYYNERKLPGGACLARDDRRMPDGKGGFKSPPQPEVFILSPRLGHQIEAGEWEIRVKAFQMRDAAGRDIDSLPAPVSAKVTVSQFEEDPAKAKKQEYPVELSRTKEEKSAAKIAVE
jgi:hypothetical protein